MSKESEESHWSTKFLRKLPSNNSDSLFSSLADLFSSASPRFLEFMSSNLPSMTPDQFKSRYHLRMVSLCFILESNPRVLSEIETWREIERATDDFELRLHYRHVRSFRDKEGPLSKEDRLELRRIMKDPDVYPGSSFDLSNFEELFHIRFILVNQYGKVSFLPKVSEEDPRYFILLYYRGHMEEYQLLFWVGEDRRERKAIFRKQDLPPYLIEMAKGLGSETFTHLPLVQEMV